MRWRGKIQRIWWRIRRGKACRATPDGVTVLSCRVARTGVTRLNFRKIITLQYDVGWRCFLYENYRSRRDLQLSSFEIFRLMTLRCSKKLYKVSTPKWSCISACRIRKIIYFCMDSNEDIIYIKVVALNEIYNFVVLSFYIWGC
jgi:hypothetical protein